MAEFGVMNVWVEANDSSKVQDLWSQYQRELRPPKRFGELRFDIDVGLPMGGPDARGTVNFARVPEAFLPRLKQNGIRYTVN
jgi:hypothetical protein